MLVQKELDEEKNGRRSELEDIRKEMNDKLHVQKKVIVEEVDKKIDDEKESKNGRIEGDVARKERKKIKDEVGKIWIALEGIQEIMRKEKLLKEKAREEKEKEWEKVWQKPLEDERKVRSGELEDFVRKTEWNESMEDAYETIKDLRGAVCEILNGYTIS